MSGQPPAREITDPATLRLLWHPLRYRIHRQLRKGPANSTTLAKALGESTGATSYHLRQLAQHGLLQELPERARGRERWWQAVEVDWRIPPLSRQDPQMRAAVEETVHADLQADYEQLARFRADSDHLGPWADALWFSRGTLRLTRAQLTAFCEDYIALLYRYQDPGSDTGDERDININLWTIPQLD